MNSFWLEYNHSGDIQEFTFEGSSVTIGRDKSSDFVLDHPTVSRQHAVIRREGPGHFVLRVLSRGGLTALDGNQVQGEVPLHDGANINLGKLTFRFRSDDAPRQPQHNLGGAGASDQRGGAGSQGAGFGGSSGSSPVGSSSASQGFGGGRGGAGSDTGSSGESGFGASNSGFGAQQNQGGGVGGFAQSSQGFQTGGQQASQGPSEASQPGGPGAGQNGSVGDEESEGEEVDIVSWDEIASSEEAMEEASPQDRAKSVFERMEEGQKKQEETRPGLIIVAGIAIVGLLGYVFFGGPTGGGGGGSDDGEISGDKQLKVEVECLGKADCVKKAKNSYNVGNEKLKKSGAAISNRFEGYKSLLEAEKYLEEAGMKSPPPSMKDLEERQKAAKLKLDKLFRNFRVAYHQAKSSKNYSRMAESLTTIQSYFPYKKSYEYRWAQAKKRQMKQNGTYPSKQY